MSLTRILVAEARIEALAMLVRRLAVDAIVKTPDPQRALCSLKSAAGELGDDADHDRQAAMLGSSKYSVFNSTALNLPRPDFGAIWC